VKPIISALRGDSVNAHTALNGIQHISTLHPITLVRSPQVEVRGVLRLTPRWMRFPPREYNCRAHRAHGLLHLPPELLEIVARKMGKRARLLCTQLRQACGPPGAELRLEAAAAAPEEPEAAATYTFLSPLSSSIIQSWRQPVRCLDLGDDTIVDGRARHLITEALPNLLELSCGGIDPFRGASSTTPHTSLTSLRAITAYNMQSVAAFAPNLRSLHIAGVLGNNSQSATADMFSALTLLPRLQHLEATFESFLLTPPSSFRAAMRALTALTHLGLDIDCWDDHGVASPEMLQSFAQALAGLPLLSSVRLCGTFRVLVPPLGAALQALSLTSLHVGHTPFSDYEEHPPLADLGGLLPDISAMPLLRHLGLSGCGAFLAAYQRMLTVGAGDNGPLRSLELTGVPLSQLGMTCSMLEHLPGLTSLSLQVTDTLAGYQEQPQDTLRLADTLSTHTKLQHLTILAMNLHGFVPCLAGLSALTHLVLSFSPAGELQRGDLQVVSMLTGLKKLTLYAGNISALSAHGA
jgi:hypothetical protein